MQKNVLELHSAEKTIKGLFEMGIFSSHKKNRIFLTVVRCCAAEDRIIMPLIICQKARRLLQEYLKLSYSEIVWTFEKISWFTADNNIKHKIYNINIDFALLINNFIFFLM